jgi:hypothetical protein
MAVPKKAVMKLTLMTATLMEFIAATPCAGGMRESAVITKDENA